MRGMIIFPLLSISTICGGSMAICGHMIPGERCPSGCRSAVISSRRFVSARCRVAVDHWPLPGTVWMPFTHLSTATGMNDPGSASDLACDGQPVQAGIPGVTAPPVVVGTGDGAVVGVVPPADACPLADGAAEEPPPDGGVDTLPHPLASVTTTSRGTVASSVTRLARARRVII